MYQSSTVTDFATQPSQDEMLRNSILYPIGHIVWRGYSGRDYPHTAYSLLGCPPPVSASYLLVHCDESGQRAVLAAGLTESEHATDNLATIRRTGAILGANEVHLCDGIMMESGRDIVSLDFHSHDGVREDRAERFV